jgi:hypothetical protein
MNSMTSIPKYHGVRCQFCGQPIRVSAQVAHKAAVFQGQEGTQNAGTGMLNLRCRVCEKENFYSIADVFEITGSRRTTFEYRVA